jgi:hypothetical protein
VVEKNAKVAAATKARPKYSSGWNFGQSSGSFFYGDDSPVTTTTVVHVEECGDSSARRMRRSSLFKMRALFVQLGTGDLKGWSKNGS